MRVLINNFLSFGEHVVVDVPVGLTLISGEIDSVNGSSNGAGKSGLLEAITFALWGKARGTGEYPGGDHLIRDGCTSMSVGITLGGIEIIRKRSNGNTSLGIVVDGVAQTFPTISAGDGLVGNRIGIDYDTFIRTAYFQQGKDKAFSELTSTEARRKVIEILGLDKWAYRQQKPKAEMDRLKLVLAVHRDFASKNIKRDVDLQIEFITLDLDVAEQVIDDINERLKQSETEIGRERVHITSSSAHVTQAETLVSTRESIQTRISTSAREISDKRIEKSKFLTNVADKERELAGYVAEVARLEGELSKINVKDLEAKLVVVDIRLSAVERGRNEVSVNLGIAEDRLKELNDKETALNVKDVGVCPVIGEGCDRISNDCLVEMRATLRSLIVLNIDNIQQMRVSISASGVAIDALTTERVACVNSVGSANVLSQKINAARTSVDYTTEILESLKRTTDHTEQIIEKMVASHVVLVDELDVVFVAERALKGLLQEVASHEEKLATLVLDKSQLDSKLTQVISSRSVQESNKGALIRKLNDIEENSKVLQILEDAYIMWDLLSQAFGPNGVPSMQIDAMKDEVEVTANNILQFGKQGVTVKIQLKEQKKTGDGYKDVFKILVCDQNDKELPLFRFSGGEGYWVDLAVRVALYLVWRDKNKKSPLDLVMIDEGMGKVDAVKRKVLIDVLRYMTTKVSQVLVITHSDIKSMVESFDNVITIRKNNDVSVATIMVVQ